LLSVEKFPRMFFVSLRSSSMSWSWSPAWRMWLKHSMVWLGTSTQKSPYESDHRLTDQW